MSKLFYIAACLLLSITICSAVPVVIDGTATVKMDIKNPIPAEQTAKDELNTYIKRIFAAYPGKSSARAQFILRHDPALDEQESARWVYFANRVARIVKKDYPKVKLTIFFYVKE